MISIPGVEIKEALCHNDNSIIYRGLDSLNHRSVVVKVLNKSHPTQTEIARFKREFHLAASVKANEVITVYDLVPYENTYAIVMEDIDGISLTKWLEYGPIDTIQFLKLAITLCKALEEVHEKNIIHKDICPSNIVYNPDNEQIRLIDFGIASEFTRENQSACPANVLEGTLAFISPEQTGRMNRVIDYRSDFYSLGATLYYLLTQKPPFQEEEPIEAVHAHIAKVPEPPETLNKSIPKTLSKIILKLLSKAPEDRYQSLIGLRLDLEECQQQFASLGTISDFSIGRHDLNNQFSIPQKLYGRHKEVEKLIEAFYRIENKRSEMILVAGYSGVGKSALIHEVHKPIVEKHGYFIAGKFDQFSRNIPYSALIQAFEELVKQLLAESSDQIARWKEKLLAALKQEGQIIIDVIPEVELIIGEQPQVPELGPQESQNRFNLVFQAFVKVFAQVEHPLVVFLDDLQWADSATLNLLSILLCDIEIKNLLLMGAYRDNEVDEAHPLVMALNEISQNKGIVNTIVLPPLENYSLNELLADTLHTPFKDVNVLGDLVMRKTGGNPFFVGQFLKRLHNDELITFNKHLNNWEWNTEEIERSNITSNIVGLMIEKIKQLPQQTQTAISTAACLGNVFDLNVLSLACELPVVTLIRDLWPAIDDELLVARTGSHKLIKVMTESEKKSELNEVLHFNHDRIQQAAYEMIEPDQRPKVHLDIGRKMLSLLSESELEDELFCVIGQLNDGISLVSNIDEKNILAKLNLRAGKKAKKATAYGPALEYLRTARQLVESNAWEKDYTMMIDLHKEWAECEYLSGHLKESERIFEEALNRATSKYDKADIYVLKMILFFVLNKYSETIDCGIEALKLFGIQLNPLPNQNEIRAAIVAAKEAKGQTAYSDAINLPECQKQDVIQTMRILTELAPPAYMSNPNLLVLVFSKMTETVFTEGNTPYSCYGLAGFAIILAGILNEREEAHQSGEASIALEDRYDNNYLTGRVYMMFTAFTNHWLKPVESNFPLIKKGFQECVKVGELRYACYIHLFTFWQRFSKYEDLQILFDEYKSAQAFVHGVKDHNATEQIKMLLHAIQSLQGQHDQETLNKLPKFDEEYYYRSLQTDQYVYGLNTFQIMKLVQCYTTGQYESALFYAQEAEKTISGSLALYRVTEHCFYYFLTLCALYPKVNCEQKKSFMTDIERLLQEMHGWAKSCPDNFQHKHNIMQGELERLNGNLLESLSRFESAIEIAGNRKFNKDLALAHELIGKLWIENRKLQYAKPHLEESVNVYHSWGAANAANYIIDHYKAIIGDLKSRQLIKSQNQTIHHATHISTSSDLLDSVSIIKASQAISGSIVLTELIEQLIRIAVENAAAQRGVLVFKHDDSYTIRAEVDVSASPIKLLNAVELESEMGATILPATIINYVERTSKALVISNVNNDDRFSNAKYFKNNPVKSVLCQPIYYQGRLTATLYLEHNLIEGAFTPQRQQLVEWLASQAAISLENARLYKALMENRDLLEQRVIDRTAQLEQANKELKAFSYTVSHDLRAPIRRIEGFTEVLLNDHVEELSASSRTCVDRINTTCLHMKQLVDGLLDLSRASSQPLKRQVVNLSKMVHQSLLNLQEEDKQREVEILVEPEVFCQGDPKLLQSAIDNLISNAWKYTKFAAKSKIAFYSAKEINTTTYHVKDNGIGFDQEKASELFSPFQRLNVSEKFDGSGIGLATVARIVKRHKGRIWASSSPNNGATFSFTLNEDTSDDSD